MWWSVGAAALAAPVIGAWVWVTQPDQRVAVALVVPLVTLVWLAFLWQRTWLDTAHGTLVREVLGVWRRRLAWADASSVKILDNHGRQVVLQVRGPGRPMHVALLADDLGGLRSQPPQVLTAVAAEMDRWAPEQERVAARLRAQAAHLQSGGAAADSPFGTLLGVRSARP